MGKCVWLRPRTRPDQSIAQELLASDSGIRLILSATFTTLLTPASTFAMASSSASFSLFHEDAAFSSSLVVLQGECLFLQKSLLTVYIRDTPGNANAVGGLRRDLALRCIIAAARGLVDEY